MDDDIRRLVVDLALAEEVELDWQFPDRDLLIAKIEKALRTGFSITFYKPRELRFLLLALNELRLP